MTFVIKFDLTKYKNMVDSFLNQIDKSVEIISELQNAKENIIIKVFDAYFGENWVLEKIKDHVELREFTELGNTRTEIIIDNCKVGDIKVNFNGLNFKNGTVKVGMYFRPYYEIEKEVNGNNNLIFDI